MPEPLSASARRTTTAHVPDHELVLPHHTPDCSYLSFRSVAEAEPAVDSDAFPQGVGAVRYRWIVGPTQSTISSRSSATLAGNRST